MYRFHGVEDVTIEIAGAFDPTDLDVPAGLELELDAEGRARVSLFAFAVRGLRITGVPLVRASYAELLWRIAVRGAWWALACDLGARGPRLAAERWVKYPLRPQAVAVTPERVSSAGDAGDLAIRLGPATPGNAQIDSRTLLTGRDGTWRVPWGDDGGPAATAPVEVERDSLSATTVGRKIMWDEVGCIRRGRHHRCGVAQRR